MATDAREDHIDTPWEAPEEIRRAWVGLVLEVSDERTQLQLSRVFGVLTGPRNRLTEYLHSLFVVGDYQLGYSVAALGAFGALESHDQAAYHWWRANAPCLFAENQQLLFDVRCCEPIVDVYSDGRAG